MADIKEHEIILYMTVESIMLGRQLANFLPASGAKALFSFSRYLCALVGKLSREYLFHSIRAVPISFSLGSTLLSHVLIKK